MTGIRPMTPHDLQHCHDLIAGSAFFSAYGIDPAKLASSLRTALTDTRSELHVIETADHPVAGFSWVIAKGGFDRSPYLRLLAVDDRVHRSGIGRQLMAAMEERHKHDGDLMLLVTQTNQRARAFYESLGYQQVGLLEDYVKAGVHECLYRKRLTVDVLPGMEE